MLKERCVDCHGLRCSLAMTTGVRRVDCHGLLCKPRNDNGGVAVRCYFINLSMAVHRSSMASSSPAATASTIQ